SRSGFFKRGPPSWSVTPPTRRSLPWNGALTWLVLAVGHASNSEPARLCIAFSGADPGARHVADGTGTAQVRGTSTSAGRRWLPLQIVGASPAATHCPAPARQARRCAPVSSDPCSNTWPARIRSPSSSPLPHGRPAARRGHLSCALAPPYPLP